MKTVVRYFSRTGNSKKLALAVAQAIDVEAEETKVALGGDTDILFLCNAVYAAGVDAEIKRFISDINVKVGKVVNISTAALLKSTDKQIEKLLSEKGIEMAKESFACKGEFKMMHKGKPDSGDLKRAADFALKITEG